MLYPEPTVGSDAFTFFTHTQWNDGDTQFKVNSHFRGLSFTFIF